MPTRAAKSPTTKTTKPRIRKTPVRRTTTVAATHARPVKKTSVKRTYIFAVGRRKEAVARVRWHANTDGQMTINERPMEQYFPTPELQKIAREALTITELDGKGHVTAHVAGGGIQGQAEAVRLGIARALVSTDPDLRLTLKRAGFLRRDPRVKERKKYGLKRARRAPQWQKR